MKILYGFFKNFCFCAVLGLVGAVLAFAPGWAAVDSPTAPAKPYPAAVASTVQDGQAGGRMGGRVAPIGPIVLAASGLIKHERRAISEFHSIAMESNADVEVQIGNEFRLELTWDDNLLPMIVTQVLDGTLYVQSVGRYRPGRLPKILIQLPQLISLTVSGDGTLDLSGLQGGQVALINSGSALLTAHGSVDALTVLLEDEGTIDTVALTSRRVEVEVDGGGRAEVNVSEDLHGAINGTGTLIYRTDHATVNVQNNGGGALLRQL